MSEYGHNHSETSLSADQLALPNTNKIYRDFRPAYTKTYANFKVEFYKCMLAHVRIFSSPIIPVPTYVVSLILKLILQLFDR